MDNKKQELITECLSKELNTKALDGVVPSIFKLFTIEGASSAQIAFNTLMIVLGFELDQETYLTKIVTELSGAEIDEVVKTLFNANTYNYHQKVFEMEYITNAQPLMKAINDNIEQSKKLMEDFEKANEDLKRFAN